MTHPIASFFITILNSGFLGFIYYHAIYNFYKINFQIVLVGLVLIFLARGSFVATEFRTTKEKISFYTLLIINLVLLGAVFWEWYRV